MASQNQYWHSISAGVLEKNNPHLTDINHSKYKPGQVWEFRAPPEDSGLSFTILKVQDAGGWQGYRVIIHIDLDASSGTRMIKRAGSPHLVFTESAIDRSVVHLLQETDSPSMVALLYNYWLEQLEENKKVVRDDTIWEYIESVMEHEDKVQQATQRVLSFIRDPYNPTKEELEWWAYDPDAIAPYQDFELIISDFGPSALIFKFASDPNCPKQKFFLSCLYKMTWGRVQSQWQADDQRVHDQLIAQAQSGTNTDLIRWAKRSLALMAHPDNSHYSLYGFGNLAWNDNDDFVL